MQGFLVERYWPGVTADDVREICARLDHGTVAGVTFLGGILVGQDEVALFAFRAPSLQHVTQACERAQLRCDRTLTAVHFPASADRPASAAGTHPADELGP
ncbi:MAG TPA: hypothetical protein VHY58_14520 [Streptosporangiaceae bacterium]|jgi:hypothetical protein|nr:hypothetical protein [Streptosporangiaceae bacterium]